MNTVPSAVREIEQQMNRAYALVAAAREALLDSGATSQSIVATLLDMAEDELSDTSMIQELNVHVGTDNA